MNLVTLAWILVAAGVLLLLAELLIPSGFFFVVAVCAVVAGVVMGFISPEPYHGWLTLLAVFVAVPLVAKLLFHLWPKTPMGKRFFLPGPQEDATLASMPVNIELEQLRGRFGRTLSPLRPAGVTDFDGRRVDTITEGMMVDEGQGVRCVDVRAGKVI